MSDRVIRLESLRKEANACRKCQIGKDRMNAVVDDGDPFSPLLLCGEAPGKDEDIAGLPFTGRAGELLNEILERAEMPRKFIYICNVVKCRPMADPVSRVGNRQPVDTEIANCKHFLDSQIELVDPLFIVCMGSPSAKAIISDSIRITKDRGKVFNSKYNRPAMPVLHTAYILRSMGKDRADLEDQLVSDFIAAKLRTRDLKRAKAGN